MRDTTYPPDVPLPVGMAFPVRTGAADLPHNRQPHYTDCEEQPIDLLCRENPEAFPGFCQGNITKYTLRYQGKDGRRDLLKARQYLHWLIGFEEARAAGQPYVPTDHLLPD